MQMLEKPEPVVNKSDVTDGALHLPGFYGQAAKLFGVFRAAHLVGARQVREKVQD